MMNNQTVSDELLNAFIDDELDLDEKSEMLEAIGRDSALKERMCDQRGLKEMMRHAYLQPPVCEEHASDWRYTGWRPAFMQNLNLPRLAVCLLLLLMGWTSGWFMFAGSELSNYQKVNRLFQATQSNYIAEEPSNVIVQVSNSNPVRLKTALDETENLLKDYKRTNRPLRVEIVANAGGLDLLRSDVSPFARRIEMLQAKYPNLDYLACGQTISRLRGKGVVVHLLPHIGIATSAADQINKRLLQGWDYVRV